MSDKNSQTVGEDERGFALIMVLFIVALATILVMNFADETFRFQRASRSYSERIQADYVLKSALGLAKVLLELPKLEGAQEDWLGDPWSVVPALASSSLPISGFAGEVRLHIVDEAGKININALGQGGIGAGNPFSGLNQNNNQNQGVNPNEARANFWKNALSQLFTMAGFTREQYEPNEFRTLGNQSFEAVDQVAILHDWIDADGESHSVAGFPGRGIEGSTEKSWFYNRNFRALSELLLVPGMTLERLSRIAPFVRVSRDTDPRINVNTAPPEVLLAIGFPESQVVEILNARVQEPITTESLNLLTTGDAQLGDVTTVRSREFTVYAQVEMPNVTRWAKATITIQGSFGRRQATMTSVEFF